MERVLLIAAGAALGANARYWIGDWAARHIGAQFPYGTLIVNVTGSLLLGVLAGIGAGRLGLPEGWRLFLAVGFCGAYTTFSSYAVESVVLFQGPFQWLAWMNVLGSNLLSMAVVLIGVWLTRFI